MFKAFKPSGMEKIARAMGYSGNMQGFQDYLAQDPMRQQQMQTYQNKAMQMAQGGYARKMYQEGGLLKQPFQINYQSAPMYEQFKQSDYYKNMPMIGSQVIGGATIDGQTYNFPMAMQANAYQDYMRSLGGYQVGGGEMPENAEPQPVAQPAANEFIDYFKLPDGSRFSYDRRTRQAIPQGAVRVTQEEFMRLPESGLQPVTQPAAVEKPFNYEGIQYNLQQGQTLPQFIEQQQSELSNFQNQLSKEKNKRRQQALRGQMSHIQSVIDKASYDYNQQQQPPIVDPRIMADGPGSRFPFTGQPPLPAGGTFNDNPLNPSVYTSTTPPASPTQQPSNVTEATIQRMYQPGLPAGGVTTAALTPSEAGQYIQPGMGTVTGAVSVPTAMAGVAGAAPVQETAAAQMQAATAAPAVDAAMQATQAAQGTVDPRAQVTAAQQTATSVGNLSAAQGNATLIDNPVQREIQAGELISGAADAAKAAQFTEQIQAAQATPSQQATVQGQLANLTANFDATNPPAWAAGALRNATAQMAARGLGASSLAGQAIVQATLEAALPIAQADAATVAQFEAQNLTNRQQRAMLAAQQRAEFMGMEFTQDFQARVQNAAKISDVANQNFTAEQQVQLENSRAVNTMNLNNLSNQQALVIAQASALAQMDLSNLNNRQQAAVQNAQSFLNMDMANLSNRQQTDLFKAQQRAQSLFTDQAATNAARQFNATSQNQVDQFFANLATQVSQFNAAQANAQAQFNTGQRNTVERFNAELNNQRDQFNAANQLAIAQANAVWRREIATANTAAINRANELNANAILDISKTAYDNLWNYYADTMEWAWKSAESQIDRNNALAIAELDAKTRSDIANEQSSSAAGSAIGNLIGTLGSAWIMCWVAREVYGRSNPEWFIFRTWLQYDSPKWFKTIYKKYGERYAKFISNKPAFKYVTKMFMDFIIDNKRRKSNVQTI